MGLRNKVYIDLRKSQKSTNDPSQFVGYVNNLLEKSIDVVKEYGGEGILDRLRDDSNLIMQFLDVSQKIRSEREIMRNYSRLQLEESINRILRIRSEPGLEINKRELTRLLQHAFEEKAIYMLGTTTSSSQRVFSLFRKILGLAWYLL